MPAEQGREIEAGADVAPGWNVALARRASAVAGSWRGAIKWAAIAATVWIGGLQLQAWRLNAASPNCARTCMAVCNRRSPPWPA